MKPLSLVVAAVLAAMLAPTLGLAASMNSSLDRGGSPSWGRDPGVEAAKASGAVVNGSPGVPAEMRAQGMTAAPNLVNAAGMSCNVSDARFIGTGTGAKDHLKAKYYEVACADDMGYVLIVKEGVARPTAINCLVMSAPGPDDKPNPLMCLLPANRNPADSLRPAMTRTGYACAITGARYIGTTTAGDKQFYELACASGAGYVLTKAKIGAPTALTCLAFDGSSPIKCALTDRARQLTVVDKLAASSGKSCVLKDRRYVGASSAAPTDFYEGACTDGKGYFFEVDHEGRLKAAIDCSSLASGSTGCTLTDTRVAETRQTALYTDLAKKAGFSCNVSKYADFPVTNSTREVVELACSNRPDGGVGIFPISVVAKARVLDCARAEAEGFRCTYTGLDVLHPKLTAQLKTTRHPNCTVTNARPFGHNATEDWIEVACAGDSGLVIVYPTEGAEPTRAITCASARSETKLECQLAQNLAR